MWLLPKLMILSVLLAFLQGCTPSHTLEKSGLYARKIGIVNQFDISRWHGRILPSGSKLFVATDAMKSLDSRTLSAVFAKGLSPFFAQVTAAKHHQSIAPARSLAMKNACDFLFFIELIDSENGLIFAADEGRDDQAIEPSDKDYKRMQLLLVVVDVVSGQTIDKIKLSAGTAHFNFLGTDMASLLAKPVAAIGRDLTGA